MSQKLTARTAALLTVPPLLWAGNAVVGRLVTELVPPITLNFLRWVVAFALMLPLAGSVLRPRSALWPHWRRYAVLGLLGVGCYNALQYLALQTSTPLNVTLVASSGPIWTLAMGALFFKAPVRRVQIQGALLSVAGVLLVLARGDWATLMQVQLVPGDLFILLATASWSLYSWLLLRREGPSDLRVRRQGLVIGRSVELYGLFVLLFGLVVLAMQTGWFGHPGADFSQVNWVALILGAIAFAAMGATDEVSAIFRSSMMLTIVPDEMRGRLQGVLAALHVAVGACGDAGARGAGDLLQQRLGGLLLPARR